VGLVIAVPDSFVKKYIIYWRGEVLDYWTTKGSKYARAHYFLKAYDPGFDFGDDNGIGSPDWYDRVRDGGVIDVEVRVV